MNSSLYECHVYHKRFRPKEHAFAYRIFMFHLDLDELDAVAQKLTFFGHNRRNLYSFLDRDHLDLGKPTLKENIHEFLGRHEIVLPPGHRITVLTLPRVLGYIFNPVSFYFCTDAKGEELCAIVEVGNTFREMKPYLIRHRDELGRFRLITPKLFYVSPFSELDLEFDFCLRSPGDRLDIRIDDLNPREEGAPRILTSLLSGRRRPLSNGQLCWLTLKYPLITLKVISLIHWHALLLWLRRIPWFAKAARPEAQQGVLHPHRSLTKNIP